ncbi:MAG: hypothetical protein PHO98_08045 [Synergistaceae bacterium]|nr:hypothetical protein [Synergistaceae bacterium]
MRLIVLLLSMGSVVLFGYALAGMGGYLLGKGRLDYVFTGLLGGFGAAVAALLLWKKYLDMILMEDTREKDRDNSERNVFHTPASLRHASSIFSAEADAIEKRTEQMRLPLNENDPPSET